MVRRRRVASDPVVSRLVLKVLVNVEPFVVMPLYELILVSAAPIVSPRISCLRIFHTGVVRGVARVLLAASSHLSQLAAHAAAAAEKATSAAASAEVEAGLPKVVRL